MAQEVAPWESPAAEAPPWGDAPAKKSFDPKEYLQKRVGELQQESQHQMNLAIGPEAKGSTVSRLGHSLLSLAPETAAVLDKVAGGLLDWKTAAVLVASKVSPAAAAAYFATQGVQQAGEAVANKGQRWSPDNVQNFLLGLSTVAASGAGGGAVKPAEFVTKSKGAAAEGIRSTAQKAVGAGEEVVSRERQAAAASAQEKLAAHTAKVAEYDKNVSVARAKARGDYEAGEAARQAKAKERYAEYQAKEAEKVKAHEEAVEKAKAQHAEKVAGIKKQYGEDVAAADKERIAQSRIEGRRTSFQRLKDKLSERFTDNVDKAEKAERSALDQRWDQFRPILKRAQVSGSALAEAVNNARKNILKGSATSIPIFNDIMGKDFIDTGETLEEVPADKVISADQVRGYVTEMGERLYGTADIPGDVYRAVKSVREAAKGLVRSAVEDTMGKQGALAYDKLNSDWNDYETTWRDKSSGSPLVRVLNTIRKPMAQKGVPVYRQIGDIVTGKTGEQAIAALARKRAFGADPGLAARVRWAERQYGSLPKPKTVAEVEAPAFPQLKVPEAPEKGPLPEPLEPPKMAKYELPKPPEPMKQEPPFNAVEFRKEAVRKEAEKLSRLTGWDVAAVGYALEELISGKPPLALTYPAGKRMLAHVLSRPGVQEWIAREKARR